MSYGFQDDLKEIRDWLKTNNVSWYALSTAVFFNSGTLRSLLLKNKGTLTTLERVLRHIRKYPKVKNPYRAR